MNCVTHIKNLKIGKITVDGSLFKYDEKPFYLQTEWLNLKAQPLKYLNNNMVAFRHNSTLTTHHNLALFLDQLNQICYKMYGKYSQNINKIYESKNKIEYYSILKININCNIKDNNHHKLSLAELKKSKGSQMRFIIHIGPWIQGSIQGLTHGYLTLNIMAIEIDLAIPNEYDLYELVDDLEDTNLETDHEIIEITI